MDLRVEKVSASATWTLRQAVLRPHQTLDQLALADDDDPTTGTFAALDEDGTVVGTVRVALDEPPPAMREHRWPGGCSWRLRGMATREDLRNRGIGGALLDAAISHVADRGSGLVWCNARVPAVNLYRRAGFVEEGERWIDPVIGPHVVMWRTVQPSTW